MCDFYALGPQLNSGDITVMSQPNRTSAIVAGSHKRLGARQKSQLKSHQRKYQSRLRR